ncbi:MAG TPA: PKD domain-containing protein [Nocardioidaceae bacterium]|nr:PKD domain-containing protein [Nocardioidaceae bacterium]
MSSVRARSTHARRSSLALIALISLALCLGFAPPALSAPAVSHDRVVSATPGQTPAVNNGAVNAIAQVGDKMVVGGTFTSVTSLGGAATTRNYVFAFAVSTGKLITTFAPALNGAVSEVIPGPTAGTVYLGGSFTTLGGANTSHVTLLNTTTGAVSGGFKAGTTNGLVSSMVQRGNRLYLGGNFTTAGGAAHNGLASLNATTGGLDTFVGNQVSQRHNDTGSGAQGAVGVRDLDVTADGSRLVAIGNFKKVDGLSRDQVVLLSLDGISSMVTANWQTNRYSPYCFNFAFDTYVRGVSFSPDGSYFVVASTGGYVADTLCDAASRFETSTTGEDIQPTWVNYSGGDTLWGVTVTEHAVYVGGHQRWLNNGLASDTAGPGAVPRPGIAALSTTSGVPLKWNPGRNPRGAAVYALYATSQGLWMGSDTEYVGNRYQYKRPRLAFFPLASGSPEASDATAGLPGTAYLGANPNANNGNILYRVNAGGATVGAVDNGPDWTADSSDPSPYRNSGTNPAGYASGATVDGTVPSTAPTAVFDSERWSPSDNPAMKWAFPAPSGAPLQVRLYFANRCGCTSASGQRSFDVSVEGNKFLPNFDIVQQTGDQRGTMRSFDIASSDGTVNVDFAHVTENPLVNAIEIVRTDQAPPAVATNDLRTVPVTTSGAQPGSSVGTAGVDWTTVRGSFVAGGKLYYGTSDGTFGSRTYSNGNFGPEVKIDPYNDPDWAGISTGSGNNYDGRPNALYGQLSSVNGMAYAGGKLYYTRTNDSNLYWRWFNADSGVIGSDQFTSNGSRDWTGTMGMFAASGKLYFVTKADGNLNSIDLTSTGPSGPSTVVDGPLVPTGGNDWRARALFFVAGNQAPANTAPTASYTSQCVDLVCTFNGSGSSDAEGPISNYAWDFGDPPGGSGRVASHTFPTAGTYPVKLTVTDPGANGGLTGSKTTDVVVTVTQASPITYIGSGTKSANIKAPAVIVPSTVRLGDTLVLTASMSNATAATSAPVGWSVVGDQTSTASLRSKVWVKSATAGDAGSSVPVTMDDVHKAALTVSAYRDVNAAAVSATASTDTNTTNHATPTTTVPAGSWVVSVWAEKTAASNTWTTPSTVSKRADIHSSAPSAVSEAVADTNGPRTGSVTGSTATTGVANARGVNWSIVLAPR